MAKTALESLLSSKPWKGARVVGTCERLIADLISKCPTPSRCSEKHYLEEYKVGGITKFRELHYAPTLCYEIRHPSGAVAYLRCDYAGTLKDHWKKPSGGDL